MVSESQEVITGLNQPSTPKHLPSLLFTSAERHAAAHDRVRRLRRVPEALERRLQDGQQTRHSARVRRQGQLRLVRPGVTAEVWARSNKPHEHTSVLWNTYSHPLEHPRWNHPVPRASNDSSWCLVSSARVVFSTPSRSSTTQRILTQMFRFSVSPRSSGVTPRTKPCGPRSGAESSGTHVSDRVVRSSDRDADRAKSVSGTL